MIPVEPVGPYLWRIPRDARPGMRVPGLVVADERLIGQIAGDASLEQLANATALPGIVKAAMAMPDIHQGYGLPVGGVVATDREHGVVSPGSVGYDINCGVRLLTSPLAMRDAQSTMDALVDALYAAIPTGVGSQSRIRLSEPDTRRLLSEGAAWAVGQGFGSGDDLRQIESEGRLSAAADSVSSRAVERGRSQLGTLGSGNHFLEVQVVEEIYDPPAAQRFGLFPGQVVVMIHTGSRGLGHQVCTDYLRITERALERYGIALPDRQLACAPVDSPEAQDYLGAMGAAANFAFANRQCITHWTREVFERLFGAGGRLTVLYDVAHNIVKEEAHQIDGGTRSLLVHRKGATRAFPGQPVIIPGDMGRYSYVLIGTERSMQETFGSTCHGAGRLMSRTAAVKAARGRNIASELVQRGVLARATGRHALEEEMPEAYKDVKDVVDVVDRFGISTRVARLRPRAVIKG
jgi:tRNA-splicing ligase RtcB (3'-phosphate/5'-hydroxy nucleic acid ligase)